MIAPIFREQVALLLRLLPEVTKTGVFALKGGTAINLFAQDMPRLSVDIDLTYVPRSNREAALRNISEALNQIKTRIDRTIPEVRTRLTRQSGGEEAKLIATLGAAIVKIEVNTIIRSHALPLREMPLVDSAQAEFRTFVVAKVVSHAELYGGKICAALDRQHPRDLFDVQQLFDQEGLTDEVRRGVLLSMMSHTRPMHELLRPHFKDQRDLFTNQFQGMTIFPYSYAEFEATRDRLVEVLNAGLLSHERELLLSLMRGTPRWELFPILGIEELPAIQWKLLNVRKLMTNAKKHAEQMQLLERCLDG